MLQRMNWRGYRKGALGRLCKSNRRSPSLQQQSYTSQHAPNNDGSVLGHSRDGHDTHDTRRKRQRQDLAQRDLFIDVLNVNATRRDAKQYLARFKQQDSSTKAEKRSSSANEPPRSIGESPIFRQHHAPEEVKAVPTTADDLFHLALVSFRRLNTIDDKHLAGISLTLSQLVRLGMHIVVTFDCDSTSGPVLEHAAAMREQGERLTRVLKTHHSLGARYIDAAVGTNDTVDGRSLSLDNPSLVFRPLFQDVIPVVPSIAYTASCTMQTVKRAEVMIALMKAFGTAQTTTPPSPAITALPKFSLDRIIMIDPCGGVPSPRRADGAHVFINLDQEYDDITEALSSDDNITTSTAESNLDNLSVLRECLRILPPTSSALIISPEEASSFGKPTKDGNTEASSAGTRRQRNPLIHNLLTNRPVVSSSLPEERVTPFEDLGSNTRSKAARSTLVKRGMHLTIVPDPRKAAWTPPSTGVSEILLEQSSEIHFPRLLHLVEDSFRRKLDTKAYLERVNGNIAGIIVAGEYEGGAILTWEQPKGAKGDPTRLVPYLDKFAVLQKAQGNAGVADIVFQAMVRSCFPRGVCWRSRSDNPVNKWYFERSVGSYKLPGGQWTMFWTTSNEDLVMDKQRWMDYVGVCRSVVPTWADSQRAD